MRRVITAAFLLAAPVLSDDGRPTTNRVWSWWRAEGALALAAVMAELPAPAPTPATPPDGIVASYSAQPLEAFKSVFLTKVPGVAMYQARVCNLGGTPASVTGGMVLQAATMTISVMDPSVAGLAGERARKQSKTYKIARVAEILSLTGALLTAGNVISSNSAVKVAFPIILTLTDRFTKAAPAAEVPKSISELLLRDEDVFNLAPGDCRGRLFLGNYIPGFKPFRQPLKAIVK